MHYVKDFDINGVVSRQVACIELHGKPNAATEGALGALGIDVDSPVHDVYKCVAVNGSIYTWELLSSGLSIISGTISGSGAEFMKFPYINLLTPAMYVVKIGDMILDSKGYLYQIDAIYSTYCTAKYQGTQLRSYVANGVHIGENEPVNGEVLWIDTDEDPEESGGGESGDNGGTQIDVVANPGQVIAVKSVDENGKPVEYKAVDLPKVPTPNWNANEGEGFIEGRTHYVDKNGIVHKLDNKYIDADWMATKEDGGAGKTVFIPGQTVNDGMWSDLRGPLVEGVVYAVEVKGLMHECKCHSYDGTLYLGNGSLFGDDTAEHNNEPFCIAWMGGTATGGMFYSDGTLEGPIGIEVRDWQDTIHNKLPEEYLPDCAVKGNKNGVLSWLKLSDKPFVEDTGELLFSHTATFSTDAAATSGVRTAANNLKLVEGAEYWLEINGDMIKCHCEDATAASWEIYDTANSLKMKRSVGYIYVYGQSAGTFTYNLYGLSAKIVLDPNYVPSNIARKSDIPKGGGANIDVVASVGQTIVVEEVDADGKPTKWKAAEFQERTHWKTETVILPETTAEYSEEDSGFLIPFVELIGGAQYKIVYNGVEYVGEILDAREDGVGEILFGNIPMMVEAGDNGIPFMGAMVDMGTNGESGIGIVVPTDGAESVTISITQLEYTPIPVQYVTNAFPYYIEIIGSGTKDDPYVCNDTVMNVRAIYESGRDIKARRLDDSASYAEGYLIYNMLAAYKDSLYIQLHFGAVPNSHIILLPNEDNSFTVSTSLD